MSFCEENNLLILNYQLSPEEAGETNLIVELIAVIYIVNF